jgi:hypothetical protein
LAPIAAEITSVRISCSEPGSQSASSRASGVAIAVAVAVSGGASASVKMLGGESWT